MNHERTLVIHSGTFKTGSTSIQLYLQRAEDHGVLGPAGATYPRLGRRSHTLHHANLVAELRAPSMFIPSRGGWKDLISAVVGGPYPITVISSESFSLLDRAAMQRVGDLCRSAGVKVRWVHYVREQAGLYNAYYVERLVTMRPDPRMITVPFGSFGSMDHIDLGFLRYATFLEQLRQAIPDADVQVRPFVRQLLTSHDAVADFCATVHLPYDPLHAARTNVGAGWKTVETARRLIPIVKDANLRGQLHGIPNRAPARQRWLQLVRSELVRTTKEAGWNAESASYLTQEIRDRLHHEHQNENMRLDAMVDFPWLQTVEATPLQSFNIGDYDDIPSNELIHVVNRVLGVLYRMPDEIAALRPPTPDQIPSQLPSPSRRLLAATKRRLRRPL